MPAEHDPPVWSDKQQTRDPGNMISPTYSNQIFPEVESLLSKILVRELKGRYLGYFGSFTWAGAAVKRMAEFAEKSKFELVGDPVEMKQAMKEITYQQCENLARAMAGRLKKDRV